MKCIDRKAPLIAFDRRSIRTLVRGKRGEVRILIGCPNTGGRSNWMPRKKRCKVGMRAYEVIRAAQGGRCRRGSRR